MHKTVMAITDSAVMLRHKRAKAGAQGRLIAPPAGRRDCKVTRAEGISFR